jgi:ABC-2 type transport system permease protein
MSERVASTSIATQDRDEHERRVPASRVFLALLRRDLRVARRELPFFLIRTSMQPLLFVIVFGYLLPKMGFTRGSYQSTLLPGVLAVSMMFSSMQSITLPMVQDFGYTKEIEDRLLAPVPIQLIAIEKIVNAMCQGTIAALFVLPLARLVMGPIPGLTFEHLAILLPIVILGAATASAGGLLIGAIINPQQIGFVFSLIVTPLLFFGCAYYPWSGLSVVPWLQYAVLINPLVYIAEGLRAALTPELPHMPMPAILAGLLILGTLFTVLGVKRFVRRALG